MKLINFCWCQWLVFIQYRQIEGGFVPFQAIDLICRWLSVLKDRPKCSTWQFSFPSFTKKKKAKSRNTAREQSESPMYAGRVGAGQLGTDTCISARSASTGMDPALCLQKKLYFIYLSWCILLLCISFTDHVEVSPYSMLTVF